MTLNEAIQIIINEIMTVFADKNRPFICSALLHLVIFSLTGVIL